jgi:hypothetical protein
MSGETVRRFTDREIADAYTRFRMAIKGQVAQVEDYVRASDYDRQVKWLTEENARLARDLYAASVDRKNALARVKELEAAKYGAYLERNQCVALIARMAHKLGCVTGQTEMAIEGWDPEWNGLVFVELPTGQASWHFHKSQKGLFIDIPYRKFEWDGHTTKEKYQRVARAFGGVLARAALDAERSKTP